MSDILTPTTAPFEQRDLKGRNVLITGASKGIGRHLAKELNKLGANLFLVSRNLKGDLDAFVEEICTENKENGSENKVYGFSCDVASIESVKQTMQQVAGVTSHLDVLVCNSGIMPGFGMGIDVLSDDLVVNTFRTNIDGYYFVTKYAMPLLTQSPGDFERTIIYVSSDAGWKTNAPPAMGMVSYGVSKGAVDTLAVIMHTNYVSDDEAALRIRKPEQKLHRVVSLHPGFVQTTLGTETWDVPEKEMLESKTSFGAISLDAGIDTLYWAITAKDGVESGKNYYKRQVVPF